jgi:hypothetical protein
MGWGFGILDSGSGKTYPGSRNPGFAALIFLKRYNYLQIDEDIKQRTAGGRIAFALPGADLPAIGTEMNHIVSLFVFFFWDEI